MQIGKQLEREQIPNPSNYYFQKYGKEITGLDLSRPYCWSARTVAYILEDETYLVHTVNLKSTTISYKNKKKIDRPESEQLRFENTYEPLVDKQTWEIVQDIRKHKRRRANFAEQDMFSGLVYCLDCGGTMVLHRSHTMDAVKNNFMCSTYKKKGKEICSGHYIREVELEAVLLDDIRRVTHFAGQNELRFAEHIRKKQGKETQREISTLQKKIDTLQNVSLTDEAVQAPLRGQRPWTYSGRAVPHPLSGVHHRAERRNTGAAPCYGSTASGTERLQFQHRKVH